MTDSNFTYHPFPEGFCDDEFWNLNKTWYTDNPDFTFCFRATALVWLPCAFLWASLPIEVFQLYTRPFRVKKWTWNAAVKIIFAAVLVLLALIDMSSIFYYYANFGMDSVPSSELVASILKAVTYVLAGIFVFLDKRRARASSGILFIFWFLSLLMAIVVFRSNLMNIMAQGMKDNAVLYVTQAISLVFLTMQVLVACFQEHFSDLDTHDKNPCPEKNASFLGEIIFSWFSPMAYKGWKKPLQEDDLWTLIPTDKTKYQIDRVETHWNFEMARKKKSVRANRTSTRTDSSKSPKPAYEPSLTKALIKTFWAPLLISACLRLTNDLAVFVTPQVLGLMTSFVRDKTQPAWQGYMYAAIMLIFALFQSLVLNACMHICFRMGMHIRGSVVAIVYRKALKMSSSAKRSSNIGEIVNLMSVDAQRFMDFMAFFHLIWAAPVQMALAIYFLYDLLGWAVFVGLAMMILFFFISATIIAQVRKLQMSQMKEKDGRIKMMSEILNGMKVLKLYGWEQSFEQQVKDVRERELTTLSKAARLSAITTTFFGLSPFVVALATFATFVLSSDANMITPQNAFVAVSLLNILRLPLNLLPAAVTMALQVNISLKRLSKYLQNEELDPDCVQALPPNDPQSVQVRNGAFSWGDGDPPMLKDININIQEGQLVAVVGQVGCGKSSLCSALLGLMEKQSGEVAVKGSVAYVPQQAWIQNLTFKENILFGHGMKKERYEKTLDACSLRTDLAMFAGGDETEIGERGTNMSGGQRQRISLARAVYSDSDVYILDDPLSAVDAHVGKHIFENVIGPNGILKKKTRILVTHGIGFLSQTDLIIVLSNGTVSEVGTYRQLLKNRGAFSDFLRTYLTEDPDAIQDVEEDPDITDQILQEIGVPDGHRLSLIPTLTDRGRSQSVISTSSLKKVNSVLRRASRRVSNDEKKDAGKAKEAEKGKLVEVEKSETGGVKWIVYKMFAEALSYKAAILFALFFGGSFGMSMGSSFWLNAWATDSLEERYQGNHARRDYRLGIYAAFGAAQGTLAFLASLTLAFGRIRASRITHDGMLGRIMRAPMAFFDTTPLGRITNRFSKDVDAVDTVIPQTLEIWLLCFYSVVSTLFVICFNFPPFIAVLVPLIAFFYFMQRYYIATSRQLKRLEAVSRSPIYSHFQESLTGSSVIIATKQTARFVRANEQRVDINNAAYYPNIVSQRWIAIRLEVVGVCVTFFTALFAVLGREYPELNIDATGIGLSISYSLGLSQMLNFFVRTASDLESNVVSVERIKEYSEIEMEADWVKPEKRPPPNWPTAGRVEFNDYQTRYRPELDLVLKGVDAVITSGEKIGIVGRTGAGKSSLTLALFRIIEAAKGTIVIDGINIADLGLHDVRSRITILPQEPVLFSGTLRLNLDPFNKFSDQEVWLALENSHLSKFVSALPEGLNHNVADGGENYSVGQRQLICLARALLRKTKILVLDEATAAIDLETDDLIQATISEKFADCTILTIAHRINTIMDSTRIMVLDQGRVKEFASPEKLLTDPNGIFYSLAKTANLLPHAAPAHEASESHRM